jgi:hypothetical protein
MFVITTFNETEPCQLEVFLELLDISLDKI